LGNLTCSGYHREKTRYRPEKPKVRNTGNENVRGPWSYETNMYIRWVEDVWRPSLGMLKVKVVVVMRMVASRSQGCGKQCEQ